MGVIGKLFKKSSELSYKRNYRKGIKSNFQKKTLLKLIGKAKDTRFGILHQYDFILSSDELVEEYQKNVPITNYDEFHQKWLSKTIDGEKNHTWPGKVNYFALTSGTTGSPSKRIPVTKHMIRSFQKTSVSQSSSFHKLNVSKEFFDAKFLVIGGSSKLKKVGDHYEGDLSGILKKNTAFIFKPLAKPNSAITKISDWNIKLEKMIEQAPSWNIGTIAGVPSWCLMLMEKIIERYQLKTIHDIWPNFEVYMHGGVFMQPYKARLDKIIGKKVFLLDTYLASEGYFAYQTSPEKEGMDLILDKGVFYEFIPFTSDFFDEEGNLRDRYTAHTLDDVVEGLDYAIVISTNAGLWRYVIGDLVQFVNARSYEIKITGRIKQYLSLAGEHLSLDNINTAIVNVGKKFDIDISEFCIYADEENQRHMWYVGVDSKISVDEISKNIDIELGELNDDYKTCRKHNLNTPILTVLSPQLFYDFLAKIGKSGAQNKFPRVLNKVQSENWLSFLEERKVSQK